jgi:arsenate-mycothiol transferase
MTKPSVLFVCVKNAGKSQMAAGLMRKIAGDTVHAYSAGTKPGDAINRLSAQTKLASTSLAKHPNLDPQLLRGVDIVVTLGREAHVDPVPNTQFERWEPTSPLNAASTASNECAWSATTSPHASPIFAPDCKRVRRRPADRPGP